MNTNDLPQKQYDTLRSIEKQINQNHKNDLSALETQTAVLQKTTREGLNRIAQTQEQQTRVQEEIKDLSSAMLTATNRANANIEIQTKLMQQDRLHKQKQREVKNVLYNLKLEIEIDHKPLTKIYQLMELANQFDRLGVNPASFDEIPDKEYCTLQINELTKRLTDTQGKLGPKEQDLQQLCSKISDIEQRLDSAKATGQEIETSIKAWKDFVGDREDVYKDLRSVNFQRKAAWVLLLISAVLGGTAGAIGGASNGLTSALGLGLTGGICGGMIALIPFIMILTPTYAKKTKVEQRVVGIETLKSTEEQLESNQRKTEEIEQEMEEVKGRIVAYDPILWNIVHPSDMPPPLPDQDTETSVW